MKDEWKEKLTQEQYHVLREKGTEAPFTGKLLSTKENGIYACAACHTPLFTSNTKFDSGSGWPSFFQPVNKDAVTMVLDKSHGMIRTEAKCTNCGGHLGHVFNDGPKPTGERYCVNSISLDFQKTDG